MRSILHLLPNLGFHGTARQSSLLASALPRTRFIPAVFSLDGPGPFAEPLREAGIPVYGHHRARRLNLENVLSLRKFLATDRPAILHVWGTRALSSLWWATLGRRPTLPKVIVSFRATDLKKGRFVWSDRQLFDRVFAFIVAGKADRAALIDAGLPRGKLHVIPIGIPLPELFPDSTSFRSANGIPAGSPLLMCVGHLETADRFVDAVWTFEILQLVDPAIQLAIIGEGGNRQRLGEKFLSARDSARGVHFLGARADAPALLCLADVVLVPHRRSGGANVVMEAMAAGRPVVATRLPHLAELVRDGETGFVVPPRDQPAMARAILRLLENPDRRRQMGEAARADVEKNNRVDTMAERYMELYDGVLGR